LESGPAKGTDDEEADHGSQIVGFLREADAGLPVKDLCRKHGFSEARCYLWRSKFGGMSVSTPSG
jgi:putative transposase